MEGLRSNLGYMMRDRWPPYATLDVRRAFVAGLVGVFANSVAIHMARGCGVETGTAGLSGFVAEHVNALASYPLLPVKLGPFPQEIFHAAVGLLAAFFYAALAERLLPGPGWLRGLLFVQPMWLVQGIVISTSRGHGLFGSGLGQATPLWSWALNAVFGIVLGALYVPRRAR